jgi:AcrR family transcriptional regulator
VSTEPQRRRRLSHEQRRSQILTEACKLFTRNNFVDVSMEEIAAATGVTRGLLNHYFGTKRELYLAVVRYLTRLPPTTERGHPDAPVESVVARNVDLFLDNAERNRQFWLALARGSGFGRDRELERVIAEVEEAYVDRILEIFGGDAGGATAAQRAALRSYGAFALAVSREWLGERRLTRAEAHRLLSQTLTAIVSDADTGVASRLDAAS